MNFSFYFLLVSCWEKQENASSVFARPLLRIICGWVGGWKSFLIIHTNLFCLDMEVMGDISNPWFPRMELSPQYKCFVCASELSERVGSHSLPVGRVLLDTQVLASSSPFTFQEYSLPDAWNSLPLPVFLPVNAFIWVITESKHEKGTNPDKNKLLFRWRRWWKFYLQC